MGEVDIVDYLTEKGLKPRQANATNIHLACFFHGEADDERGRLYISTEAPNFFWQCFVCGETGGLNKIRKFFGDVPLRNASADAKPDDLADDTLQGIFNAATEFYHEALGENAEAFAYLRQKRGLTYETITKFKLGYSNGNLLPHLMACGFTATDIKKTGLVDQFGADTLKGQITLPYLVLGNTVTIRGKDIEAKYFSLPGSKAMLFNMTTLLESSRKVVICEGEFDCMTLDQLGFDAVGIPGANSFQDAWVDHFSECKRVYICLDNDKAGRAGAEKMSLKLGQKAKIVEMPEGRDVNDWVNIDGKNQDDFNLLFGRAVGGLLVTVDEAYSRWLELEGNPNLKGLRFNILEIDQHMRYGMLPGQVVTLLSKTNSGKCHEITCNVMTPLGIRKWGDLVVGDEVFGSNGQPTQVTNIFDRGVLASYRFTFSDGTSVLAGLDHIWTVEYRYGKYREWTRTDMTTEELIAAGLRHGKEWRFRIPMIEPVQYPERALPIGPYTMGAILANGSLSQSTPTLVTPDTAVADRVKAEGVNLSTYNHTSERCQVYGLPGLGKSVRSMGLDVLSGAKFIPEQYQLGSVGQRFALLQGLMDGDGQNVGKGKGTNRVSLAYHTTSPQLAKDAQRLVSSLGGTGKIHSTARVGDNGKPYEDIRVSIMLPEVLRDKLFTDRKDSDFRFTNKQVPHRAITSIVYERDSECRCITVAAEDSLYAITENYILTHNTVLSINLFHRMSLLKPDIKILFISLEQTRNEWFERARRIHSFYDPWVEPMDTVNYWRPRLHIVDKNRVTGDELREVIEQYKYEVEAMPDVICIDYLGYMARSYKGEAYERTTAAIMDLKSVAKDYQTLIFTPHQVNRTAAFGQEIKADQAQESVTGDTRILLSDGRYERIDNLVGTTPDVVTMDDSYRLVSRPTTRIFKQENLRQVYRVKTQTGRTYRGTSEHPVYTPTGWVYTENLKIGDTIAVCDKYEAWGDAEFAHAELLGMLIADGGLTRAPVVFTKYDPEIRQHFHDLAMEYGDVTPTRLKDGWSIRGTANGVNPLANWIRPLGLAVKSPDRFVPPSLLTARKKDVALFLRGLISCDGSVSGGSVRFDSASLRLAQEVQHLLQKLGVRSVLSTSVKGKGIGEGNLCHRVVIKQADSLIAFEREVGLLSYKGRRLRELVRQSKRVTHVSDVYPPGLWEEIHQARKANGLGWASLSRNGDAGCTGVNQARRITRSKLKFVSEAVGALKLKRLADGDIFFDPVVEVVLEPELVPVYDMTVVGTHNFCGEGLVLSNSGAVEQTSDMMMAIWNPDQQQGVQVQDFKGETMLKILKSRDGGVGQMAKLIFANRTLALIPISDPLVEQALDERQLASGMDSWEQIIYRWRSGDRSIKLDDKKVTAYLSRGKEMKPMEANNGMV